MKKGLFSILMIAAAMGFQSTAFADGVSKEVMVGINDAFIPGGFNSGSDAFVVASGVFPNGCYKWSRSDVTNPSGNMHEVRSYATVQQGLCIMVLVPFNKEVRLGKLDSGTHYIRFLNGDGTYLEKQMVVE